MRACKEHSIYSYSHLHLQATSFSQRDPASVTGGRSDEEANIGSRTVPMARWEQLASCRQSNSHWLRLNRASGVIGSTSRRAFTNRRPVLICSDGRLALTEKEKRPATLAGRLVDARERLSLPLQHQQRALRSTGEKGDFTPVAPKV